MDKESTSISGLSDWRMIGAVGATVLTGLIFAVAAIGGPLTPGVAGLQALYWICRAGWPPALFLCSAIGLGRLLTPLLPERPGLALQGAFGLSLQLTACHLINLCGPWLPGIAWNLVSIAWVAFGLVLFFRTVARMRWTQEKACAAQVIGLLAMTLAAAVLLVGACQPPGVLWASEFGGFDALSYHLQLPREWLEMHRLWPVEHNVYSYLPSYVESAFLTIQLVTFAPRTSPQGVSGMLVDDGWRVISCQLLHAGMAGMGAWAVGAAAAAWARRGEVQAATKCGVLSAAAFLCVPWVIVTGSLAYNEMAMCALIAGALLVCAEQGLKPTTRGMLAGWLVGVACGVKPTALVLGAPAVGLALLCVCPAREWLKMFSGTVLAGAAALAPWLLRNWLACGNPVFPYAHEWFGAAHWTAEQYKRFAGAHHFDGPWKDRLALLVRADPTDPAGPRHRGLMHPQWSIFFLLVGAAAAAGAVMRTTHRASVLLTGMLLLQLGAWLTLTHVQSRFLLPLAVTGAVLVGLAAGAARVKTIGIAAALAIAFIAVRSLDTFWSERGGTPNALLAAGPEALVRRDLREGERAPVTPGETLYLLGDSTPFYITGPLVYHTTWDRSPLGEAMSHATWTKDGPDSGEVSRALLAQGIGAVLVNQSELDRLISARWYDSRLGMSLIGDWIRRGTRVTDGGNDLPLIVRPIDPKASKP
ncbi:MAG: hypothetical protein JSR52_12590 [Planctomycetes bacterium]|nr:hypothetical protein [Planctomycetota bacterium]